MRILIVSNRLPFNVIEKEGELRFQESIGGLTSGLRAYLDPSNPNLSSQLQSLWVGWPGSVIEEKRREELKQKARAEFNAYPVFLPENVVGKYYNGFCNKTIWPLFHYFPSKTVYDESFWTSYKRVNETFCETLLEVIQPNDVVWIHDFHLMLLPNLLREKVPDLPIGFFLHIPYPSFEIFRLLPGRWRREILEGLLGADLIGFHTHEYTQYFLRSLFRILGKDHEMGEILHKNRLVKAGTFPMGIDFQRFYEAPEDPEVQKERKRLQKKTRDCKTILSIDRLDYTKGILNRLQGYEILLDKNPKWRGKINLILIVVPSRTKVELYQQMKKQIDEMVGRINGRFGSIDWTPVLYQYRSLPPRSLVAHYSVSDVALVTPLRDGMNLIAKEYITTLRDQTGVLILSEMAGASQELGEALLINPSNPEEIAEALKEALEMDPEEQKRRSGVMQKRLKEYDVFRWADEFIHNLLAIREEQEKRLASFLDPSLTKELVKDFFKAKKRLIFLDYDGTLVPFHEKPQEARPTEEVINILKKFTDESQNDVVLISGRDRGTLQSWFGSLPLGLIAEHGTWFKEKEKDWEMIKPLSNDWKSQILPLMERYAMRLPGALVEEKEYSLVWHYRGAEPELSSLRAKELIDDLVHFTANIDVQVFQGNKIVEVRNSGVNKGTAGLHWTSKNDSDFILAIGDDGSDEDLFMILPKKAYTIRVGMAHSHAKYCLSKPQEVLQLLEELTKER
ncbi:bifunctional alpha,alpha-trehalose-phosphate synthase (UDP-forming)/trehalose-phosphatase [candidate division TA06 bacterium]|nr:bifunctional alpha,alpha-trehalose-phosphate synthase (UDP-forming)/trehalose-phosphatase [candidate division TA06 bacterium]